jgi:hypothetical protein
MYDYNCASLPGPLKRVAEIFSQIDEAVLINVFESRIEWLLWVITQEGEYHLQ